LGLEAYILGYYSDAVHVVFNPICYIPKK
jgi:hypothetical protein